MTLEQAIYRACGVTLKAIPADGRLREFPCTSRDGAIAGRWYCISLGDCAAFGRIGDESAIAWVAGSGCSAGSIERLNLPHPRKPLSPAMLNAERAIVAAGHAVMDSGKSMRAASLDRYIQAMEAVIWHDERALAAEANSIAMSSALDGIL